MVIWIVGLSGAGKTTLGSHLWKLWRTEEPNTVLVDGDQVRRLFDHDHGPGAYSVEGRRRNYERMTEICRWLDDQGINVVCCILSIFPDRHAENRTAFSKYFEVFVDAPLDVLRHRDTKELYEPALKGDIENVVGVDIPFTPPADADMCVDNSRDGIDLQAVAAGILAKARMVAQ
jgi:adenylylsulfate kinase